MPDTQNLSAYTCSSAITLGHMCTNKLLDASTRCYVTHVCFSSLRLVSSLIGFVIGLDECLGNFPFRIDWNLSSINQPVRGSSLHMPPEGSRIGPIDIIKSYIVSQKRRSKPILIIFDTQKVTKSYRNLTPVYAFVHYTWKMSLHYFVNCRTRPPDWS